MVITTFPFVGGSKTYTDDIVEVFEVRNDFGRRRGPVCPSIKHDLPPSSSYRTNTRKNTRKKMKTASEGRQSCLILPAVSLEGAPGLGEPDCPR